MNEQSERNAEIVRLHVEEGHQLADLARRFGLSRERVRQIIRRAGVSAMESRMATGYGIWTCRGCGQIRVSSAKWHGRRIYCSTACRRKHSHPNRGKRKYTKAQLITHMRRLGQRLGRTPTQKDVVAASPPSAPTYYDAFGSFPEALVAAGFMPNRKPNKP